MTKWFKRAFCVLGMCGCSGYNGRAFLEHDSIGLTDRLCTCSCPCLGLSYAFRSYIEIVGSCLPRVRPWRLHLNHRLVVCACKSDQEIINTNTQREDVGGFPPPRIRNIEMSGVGACGLLMPAAVLSSARFVEFFART